MSATKLMELCCGDIGCVSDNYCAHDNIQIQYVADSRHEKLWKQFGNRKERNKNNPQDFNVCPHLRQKRLTMGCKFY